MACGPTASAPRASPQRRALPAPTLLRAAPVGRCHARLLRGQLRRQAAHVGAARRREHAQAELRQDGQQVVEQVALNRLVVHPARGGGKALQLHRHALGRGLHHAHHQRHVFVDALAFMLRETFTARAFSRT